ncbi:acetyltransferase [Labrys miyagiensis]|uniref:Acetyltransferase n=1 Tax=Labrys miyagiensis TaxID=346912 RepID=A0ABQ6CH91_9HYPH|nr:GNAT family protein [Labrys miyagiensis]GLS18982.1 acetyltransferase [Labrys miyagiensis]
MAPLPLGKSVDILPRPMPERRVHEGASVRLEPLAETHVPSLWQAAQGADFSFSYLRYGPFASEEAMAGGVLELSQRTSQPFWAVCPTPEGTAKGWLSLCDIEPANAAIEIGSVWYSPALQRSRAATEAIFLLMRHAFDDLAYQRLVWRCAALNAASQAAARRYGFQREGIWRSAVVVKGWQRDVAWFSMLATEWPARKAAIGAWLADGNFTADGHALERLER